MDQLVINTKDQAIFCNAKDDIGTCKFFDTGGKFISTLDEAESMGLRMVDEKRIDEIKLESNVRFIFNRIRGNVNIMQAKKPTENKLRIYKDASGKI